MANPFFYGGRIEDPNDFVGRKVELRTIFSALESFSKGQAQHISVVGERRIGKSSLLYHVTQIYKEHLNQPSNYKFVYVDLDNTHNHTLEGLLLFILKQLEVSAVKRISLNEFNDLIEKLHKKKNVCPVLCLDEFEHLANRKDEFPNQVYEALRSLGSNNNIAFLTASKSSLSELIHHSNMTSTFPNIFSVLTLGKFSDEESRELVARAAHCDRPFTEDECEKVLSLARNHPSHLQIAGKLLYDAKYDPGIKADWKRLKKELLQQTDQINSKSKPIMRNIFKSIFTFLIVSFPSKLGYFILDILKIKDVQGSTAIITGWIIILFIISFLFGWLNLDLIKRAWFTFSPNEP